MKCRHAVALSLVMLFGTALPSAAQWRSDGQAAEPYSIQPQSTVASGRKSVLLAAVFSLALPGMGEWYAGDLSAGKYNLIAEGGLWLTYGGFKLQSGWIREDARVYATQHAGAAMEGKNADFEVNIGEYLSRDAYNQAMLRNRAYDEVYTAPGFEWEWQSVQQMTGYRSMRIRSDQANNNAKFAVAGLVINRIISAFAAARMASRFNSGLSENRWEIDVRSIDGGTGADGLTLNVRTSF